jgi:ATPase family AAA domain-containing protein 3A/B
MAAAAAKASAAAISAGATAVLCSERAHAEGGATFRFPGFSSPALPPPALPPAEVPADKRRGEPAEEAPRVSNQYARTTAPGFDPAPLERGLEALKELNKAQKPQKVGYISWGLSSLHFRYEF